MARIKQTTVYKFYELSDAAKEKARDWYRNAVAGDDFWQESALDAIAEAGNLLGIEFDRKHSKRAIWFSGSWSQGDGASYDGTWRASDCKAAVLIADYAGDGKSNVELRRIASALGEIAGKYPEARASASSSHRGHFLTVDTDCGGSPADAQAMQDDRWRDAFPADDLTELLRDFAAWAYRLLESEYEYANSNEQVDESIRVNEYEFTEDGDRA